MVKERKGSGGGARNKTIRVRGKSNRSASSTRWLQRQLNDPYVAQAKRDGFRSRAAYKLIEIDQKYRFLRSGRNVIDLGAAPGSWSQVALSKLGLSGKLVGIDLLDIHRLPRAEFIKGDFFDTGLQKQIKDFIGGKADVVLSDMAANTTGNKQVDHLRTMALCEGAFEFAIDSLKMGGTFIAKTFQGGTEPLLLKRIKQHFRLVRHFKPKSSRQESPEMYLIAVGYNGKKKEA